MGSSEALNFIGTVLGAAITVWGSVYVVNYQARKRAKRDKDNLLSFLAMLEARLQFTSSDEALNEFVTRRDVPGFINRCALVVEMAELLDSPAVAEAAEGYRQLYVLHRLRRLLKVWAPAFAEYADLPFTDFYILASAQDFDRAVAKVVKPAAIIRASVHIYIAEMTGRNVFLEEIAQQTEGMNQTWDPDYPYVPDVES